MLSFETFYSKYARYFYFRRNAFEKNDFEFFDLRFNVPRVLGTRWDIARGTLGQKKKIRNN